MKNQLLNLQSVRKDVKEYRSDYVIIIITGKSNNKNMKSINKRSKNIASYLVIYIIFYFENINILANINILNIIFHCWSY